MPSNLSSPSSSSSSTSSNSSILNKKNPNWFRNTKHHRSRHRTDRLSIQRIINESNQKFGGNGDSNQVRDEPDANTHNNLTIIPATTRNRKDWKELEGENYIELNLRRHDAAEWIKRHTDSVAVEFQCVNDVGFSSLLALGAGHKARQNRSKKKKHIKRQQAKRYRPFNSRLRRTGIAKLTSGTENIMPGAMKIWSSDMYSEELKDLLTRMVKSVKRRNDILLSAASGKGSREKRRNRKHQTESGNNFGGFSKEDFVDNHTDLDFQSAERLAQQSLLLRAEKFGIDSEETKAGSQLLHDIYRAQHSERILEMDELDKNQAAHISRLAQRKNEMLLHLRGDSSQDSFDYLKCLLSPRELQYADISNSDNVDSRTDFPQSQEKKGFPRKYIGSLGDLGLHTKGYSLTSLGKDISSTTATTHIKGCPKFSLKTRFISGGPMPNLEKQREKATVWRTSNRLAAPEKVGANTTEFQTTAIMQHLAKKEYNLVLASAAHAESQMSSSGSTVVKALLASAVSAAKTYPTLRDFMAEVKIEVRLPIRKKERNILKINKSIEVSTRTSTLVIGETFNIHYSYCHPDGIACHHPEGDWLGLFYVPSSVPEKDLAVHPDSHLVAWCDVPHANTGEVLCEYECYQLGEYRVAYFLQESSIVVAASESFLVRQVHAHLSVPKIVRCGEDLIVKYAYDYQKTLHSSEDVIVLLADDDSKPCREKAIKVTRLPSTNEGYVLIEGGVVTPGRKLGICTLLTNSNNYLSSSSPICTSIL